LDILLENEGYTGSGDRTFEISSFGGEPMHIVSVTASLVTTKRNTGTTQAAMEKQLEEHTTTIADSTAFYATTESTANQQMPACFSLFTIPAMESAVFERGGWHPHEDSQDGRTYICTGSLTLQAPSWQNPPDLFGYFCDGGLHVEFNAPTDQYGIRVVLNYIDRAAFSPAYGDPVKVLQHYWSCAHDAETEFLQGFYGGNTFNMAETSADSSGTAEVSGTYFLDAELNPDTGANPDAAVHTESEGG